VGRISSDRVMRLPKPSIKEYALACPQGGRPPKHGKEFRFANPETWPEAAIGTVTDTTNYGRPKPRSGTGSTRGLAERAGRPIAPAPVAIGSEAEALSAAGAQAVQTHDHGGGRIARLAGERQPPQRHLA
jgi:hypothetical protein